MFLLCFRATRRFPILFHSAYSREHRAYFAFSINAFFEIWNCDTQIGCFYYPHVQCSSDSMTRNESRPAIQISLQTWDELFHCAHFCGVTVDCGQSKCNDRCRCDKRIASLNMECVPSATPKFSIQLISHILVLVHTLLSHVSHQKLVFFCWSRQTSEHRRFLEPVWPLLLIIWLLKYSDKNHMTCYVSRFPVFFRISVLKIVFAAKTHCSVTAHSWLFILCFALFSNFLFISLQSGQCPFKMKMQNGTDYKTSASNCALEIE